VVGEANAASKELRRELGPLLGQFLVSISTRGEREATEELRAALAAVGQLSRLHVALDTEIRVQFEQGHLLTIETPRAAPAASTASAASAAAAPLSPDKRPTTIDLDGGSTTSFTTPAAAKCGSPSMRFSRAPGKPMCPYGSGCYRHNPEHFRERDHPLDHPLIIDVTGSSARAAASAASTSAPTSGAKRPREEVMGREVILLDDDDDDDDDGERTDAGAGSRHSGDEGEHAATLVRHAPQLAELEAMGFMDAQCNRLALDESGGDLGEALELLIQWAG